MEIKFYQLGSFNLAFDKIVKFLPFPYCGKILMESPDLEAAAENCLKQQKSQRKFGSLIKKLNLRRIN